jgi:hypothetical protein
MLHAFIIRISVSGVRRRGESCPSPLLMDLSDHHNPSVYNLAMSLTLLALLIRIIMIK